MRFWIGIILMCTNQPLGWGAMLFLNGLAIHHKSSFLSFLGFAIYALSWGMLALGVWMAGPQGVAYAKSLYRRIRYGKQIPDKGDSPIARYPRM